MCTNKTFDPNATLGALLDFFADLADYGNGGERPKGARRLAREAVANAAALNHHLSNGGELPNAWQRDA